MLGLSPPTDQQWLTQRLRGRGDRPALVWSDVQWSYDQLVAAIETWRDRLTRAGIVPGDVVAICGDYSPNACSLLLACALNGNIIVPLTRSSAPAWARMINIAEVGYAVEFDADDDWRLASSGQSVTHRLLHALIERRTPGLILFSSGSTGESKASVLDLGTMLEKFRPSRPAYRTLAFLLMDHIGGINTLLHVLTHGGTIVTARDRAPDTICAAIDRHQIQLLPTTPTFLRMLLISDAIARHSLKSLEIVTYGTEPMPASTLAAVRESLPWVRLKQTYGLSELGILPTYTRESGSLWLKLGDAGFEHKIIDGVLWIRSEMAMLGYLNAPSPFDPEGWFNTQDLVEVDGEFIRILGRKSEVINVGGEKVHPTEVEDVLLQMDNVREATVSARPNPVTGQVVAARITLLQCEDPKAFKSRTRKFCLERLERYKIPAVIEIVEDAHHGERFKKSRRAVATC
jgi:acyl-CoA synthetase (AMP-forming)/AMP-acid ligase II